MEEQNLGEKILEHGCSQNDQLPENDLKCSIYTNYKYTIKIKYKMSAGPKNVAGTVRSRYYGP